MSTRKKRQHFVPQGYLKRFQSNDPIEKVPRIWVVDRNKDEPFNVPIKTVASRDAFYDSVIDDGIEEFENHGVENLLEREEGKFYQSLALLDEAILAGKTMPNNIKTSIAWYIYVQLIRTSKFRNGLETPEENSIKDYRKVNQIYGFMYKDLIEKFMILCLSKIWIIRKMTPGMSACTSDNPVFFSFDDYEEAMVAVKRGGDLIDYKLRGMRVVFPLDSKHVLFLYDSTSRPDLLIRDGEILDFDSEELLKYWLGTCSNCERQLYISQGTGIAEILKVFLSLDETTSKITDLLTAAVEHIALANQSVKGTRINSYSGFLANERTKPLFDAVKKLGGIS